MRAHDEVRRGAADAAARHCAEIRKSVNRKATLASLLVVLLLIWAAVVSSSGGIVVDTWFGQVTSRDPMRSVLGATAILIALLAYLQHRLQGFPGRLSALPWSHVLAGVSVAAALLIGIKFGSFIGGGPDASGYVSQASLWARGELTKPLPFWVHDAPWIDAAWSATPVGYRARADGQAMVPIYAPGLPMLMGLAETIVGADAVFYVVPVFGAVTIFASYLLGAYLGGSWAGAITALLVMCSPSFLLMLVQPMSDVPAAACWSLALYFACQCTLSSSVMAGAAAGIGLLVRPNLAPLAALLMLILLTAHHARMPRLALFAAPVVVSVLTIAALNSYWYGSPLRSGYGGLDYLYSVDRVWPNLKNYLNWLTERETPIVLIAPLLVLLRNPAPGRWKVVLITLIYPLLVLGLYLPYFVFDNWTYLRFLLPAFPALFAGVGTIPVVITNHWRRHVAADAVAAAMVLFLAYNGLRTARGIGVFSFAGHEQRFARAVSYCRQLPPNAVLLSLVHSGTLHFYTGRDVLRWEILHPEELDSALAYLREHRLHPYLVGEPVEFVKFKNKFAQSEGAAALDLRLLADLDGVLIHDLAW